MVLKERAMRITFAGAAGTVTGSRYLVETQQARILVDCGLFQGVKSLRERNWAPLPFDPATLDAVVLTHAHVDHSGYLPRLVKNGFRGRVWCTPGTRDLLQILLPDSGFLQEEEARRANRYEYAHHHPALPLYTREEAERCLGQLTTAEFHAGFSPAAGIEGRFTRAGHILGSACLTLHAESKTLAFSGDVGRLADPVMRPPEKLPACDYLVVESTYGDRRHPQEDTEARLAVVVHETVERGGTLVVPAFAVGRAQHLLHLLSRLRQRRAIPAVPTYLDSPMAVNATELLLRHAEDHRLTPAECEALGSFVQYTKSPEDSKAIDRSSGPKIIISASGMATGGRVLHHLQRFLPDPQSTVLLVGYQANGTRGRSLLEGAEELKIHGQYVPVRAHVAHFDGLSAHGDYTEIVEWLRQSAVSPRRVFVTHGEPGPADALRRRLRDAFGWQTEVPELGASVSLE
jgi:metallo-beta-lactamase family protein